MEAGKEPNFIFIIENNVQDPHASNPSASAGKYLVYGEGPLKELFLKEGLKPDSSTYLMANNYNFSEEKFAETQVIAEKVIEETSKTMPSKKVTKKYAPTKVATPGTFLGGSGSSSDDDEDV